MSERPSTNRSSSSMIQADIQNGLGSMIADIENRYR
jgi:hypothetical protein